MRTRPPSGAPLSSPPPNIPAREPKKDIQKENTPIDGSRIIRKEASGTRRDISASRVDLQKRSKVSDVASENLYGNLNVEEGCSDEGSLLPSSSSSPPPSPPASSSSSPLPFISEGDASPNGLKLFLSQRGRRRFVARSESYRSGDVIMGRYLYVRDKRFGVEPGFEGVKLWTERDSTLLQSPNLAESKPRYHQAIYEFIVGQLKTDIVYQDLAEMAGFDRHNPEQIPAIVNYLRTCGNAHVNETMRVYANENILKFHKLHYIKLDYPEPESEMVSIPRERAKTTSDTIKKTSPLFSRFIKYYLPFLEPVGQHIHQRSRQGTVREMNLGAVKEALANDVYEAWDFGGQNLKILHSHYQNGQSKLLLDGAHVQGKLGEPFSTLTGQIKYGQLVGNCVRDQDGRLYPIDTRELARAKVKALLMGDFDKIGSEGGNLGFVVENGWARLKNIDPGKALEGYSPGKTDRMTQENLHTDLSFDQPSATLKDRIAGGYKNFTIFDDTLLSERMQGMQDVLDHWEETRSIFVQYIQAFDGSNNDLDISFQLELQDTLDRLKIRKDYFEEVLSERLSLLALGPEKLDFLDNVEKLTSATIDHVGTEQDPIGLRHLRVVPESRKEWHMIQKPEEGYLLWHIGNEEDAISTRVNLQEFLLRNPAYSDLESKVTREGGLVTINIENEGHLSRLMEAMSEDNIARFKNQKLMSYTPRQLDLISRFEKFTSPTVPPTDNSSSSELLSVVPETRKRWELRQSDTGEYLLVLEGQDRFEGDMIRASLFVFSLRKKFSIHFEDTLSADDRNVVIRIGDESTIEEFLQMFSEANIKEFKGQ